MHSQKGNILVVWLVVAALLWLIAITLGIGGPQSQVISQQLHDECWVFVWVLIECVQLGYRVIERLSGEQNTYIFISICNREIIIIYIDILTMQNAGKVNANASSKFKFTCSVLFWADYNESISIRVRGSFIAKPISKIKSK